MKLKFNWGATIWANAGLAACSRGQCRVIPIPPCGRGISLFFGLNRRGIPHPLKRVRFTVNVHRERNDGVERLSTKQSGGFRVAAFQAIIFMLPLLFSTGLVPALAASQVSGPATRSLTDETGRRVKIPADVKRVVSLAPNLTEIVFALGKGDQLAGDTDFCDYPPEATKKPHVGGPQNPNFEQIVALKPDLILATAINRHETVDALDRLGLPVFQTDPHSVNEMVATVEHIGNALNLTETTAPLVNDLRARLGELDRRLTGTQPRRVLFIVWTDPLISVGRDTFIADALRHAGARSVVDTGAEWPRVNLEEIVKLQPEFLVFAGAHAGDTQHDIDALRSRPGWRQLNAMRQGNIVVISDAINRPAPRMVDAIEQLARALHPELFVAHKDSSAVTKQITEEACACVH
jgi:iron complex transport system substrate-binding protein